MSAQREPRRCVAPTGERIETEEHRRVVAAERIYSVLELPEAGPLRRALVDQWLDDHPELVVGAELLCGAIATTERTVVGVEVALCEEHAAEIDAEIAIGKAVAQTRRGG